MVKIEISDARSVLQKTIIRDEICAPGLGLHALPHAPDLPIIILAVEIDAQAVQDSEPLVACCSAVQHGMPIGRA